MRTVTMPELVAQARAAGLTLRTADRTLASHGNPVRLARPPA
jgi:hypothetical protein